MDQAKRNLLKFMLTSPLMASAGFANAFDSEKLDPDLEFILSLKKELISKPEDGLNVFDFEAVARENLSPAHYGYLASGVSDEISQIANRKALKRIKLIPRRLRDMQHMDTSITLFGRKWNSPIMIAPAGSQGAYHDDAELAVARAAKKRDQLMMLSTLSSKSLEDVNAARGEPVWFQFYPRQHWPSNEIIMNRAEDAGNEIMVITVDMIGKGKRETLERFIKMDDANCAECHGEVRSGFRGKPMLDNIDFDAYMGSDRSFGFDMLKRIIDTTSMKVLVKGITNAEDALGCLDAGADGIIVSNHGGRAEVSSRGTIDILPEIVRAVNGRVPVMVDGGIRRGSDVYKALALGASAVGIGRPYLWGLGAFGEEGVKAVLEILDEEFKLVMKQQGTNSINDIKENSVVV
ncbi:alpha-hydroxy acid oxidase [Pseudemcibacter aquimaris]|uniref:alpha-hydroxy acid oxidase n=1 Tax=Pseudemcibacter aquimaris TaxID=2857064 RepID=UPI0020138292|nr:alpha-hydroxy acid oxidase [Pseudemcibacter aquimaris]MCC3860502.1 alpha-hydroxy-acid oxidizing protein [Pseudemcibacter aquimaris]WDU59327.1 alpha-hydroxy-acid oxidizing protein [Pseudemcibacter aquimaris]